MTPVTWESVTKPAFNRLNKEKEFEGTIFKKGKATMKKFKKLFALVVAAALVLAMGLTAVAAEGDATTGSITVKNATKGHTYTAYKVFDATYDGEAVSYKTAAANAENLDDTLFGWSTVADDDGNISVWALEDAAEEDIIDWVEANYDKFGGTAIDGVFDDENSTVTFSGLDFGYYYITSSLGAAVTIDSAVPMAEVYDKNETTPVGPTKTIVSVDGTSQSEVTEANAHVGSVVGFKIVAKTNNWIDKDNIREEWEITDTPTNMKIDEDSIVVNFNGSVPENYTAVIDDDGKLTINVPMVDDKGNSVFEAPADGLIPIEITYSATITADAGDSPAKNEIPGGGTEIYTYMFELSKTDGTDALLGAEFEIYNGDTLLTFEKNDDGDYVYTEGGSLNRIDLKEVATAVITGLDNRWDLTVKEVVVPNGYNQAEDTTIEGSTLVKVEDGADPADCLIEVVNKQGSELPSTGGIGTTIFYILGSILVIGAGVVLVTRRRMDV